MALQKETLNHQFPEFFALLMGCKFNNCVHTDEPGCAVRKAVEEGKVSEERYGNYVEMYAGFDEGPYR